MISWANGATDITVPLQLFQGDAYPRTFVEAATVNFSVAGAQVQSGVTRPARYVWAISAVIDAAVAFDLQDLYKDWDTQRATGAVAVVTVTDSTFKRKSDPAIVCKAVFTAAPVFAPRNASGLIWADLALIEVD